MLSQPAFLFRVQSEWVKDRIHWWIKFLLSSAFDHNGDGSISQGELREAMLRFGHTFTEEECEEMFRLSDLNADGKIDWDEFLQMMLPGHKEMTYIRPPKDHWKNPAFYLIK